MKVLKTRCSAKTKNIHVNVFYQAVEEVLKCMYEMFCDSVILNLHVFHLELTANLYKKFKINFLHADCLILLNVLKF